MDLIQIDDVNFKTPQTAFTFAANGVCLQRCANPSFVVPDALAFCEYKRTRCAAGKSPSDHLFRMAETIERGRIDPVHAMVERSVNGGNGVAIILRPHASCPTASTNGPSTDADRADAQIA